ncbi:MAG TPA: NAD(P)/FAD-dependent oxidoreductase, partial [Ruania sp.]|nr:NAD(P)/FAD-dependent oxidoreductase [Ruania sp.]
MSRTRLLVVGGGQSGLAAARAGRDRGWEPVVLEAGAEPVGSWPAYYDSLRLFSSRQFSSFPGYEFPGPAHDYPARDEVVEYLRGYASWLGVDIRTRSPVADVTVDGAGAFTAHLTDGDPVCGDVLIAASGSFANPYIPQVTGQEKFTGHVLTVAEYRSPQPFAGKRLVVVGAGNSAVQVGYELAQHADVTLAVRDRVRLVPQVLAGRDLHWWLHRTRADLLPPALLSRVVTGTPVIDAGRYHQALHS